MTTTPVNLRVELPVPPGRTATDYLGKRFEPDTIVHQAYVYEGKFYRVATAFGGTGTNVDVTRDPSWPQPGAWFDHIADEIAATVEGVA